MKVQRNKWQHYILIAFISLIPCCSGDAKTPYYGYIEGEYTYIASGISGTLFQLFVNRGQPIEKGHLLYTLDPEPEQASVKETKANIADLEAQLVYAKIQLERQQKLLIKNAAAQADVDEAQTNFNSKKEQLAANKAQLIQTQWALQQKTSYAPKSGYVFDTYYRVGEKVQDNHPVLAILAPENIKVLFYIPERLLSQVKLEQQIKFTCDGCKEETLATISYISPEAEYTPPVIYSKDTRYKLVYLIRAKMPPETAIKFHPGQPIDVYLHE